MAARATRCFGTAAEKKGYSGTVIFTRVKPRKVTLGIGVAGARPRGPGHHGGVRRFFPGQRLPAEFAARADAARLPDAGVGPGVSGLPEEAQAEKAGDVLRRPERGAHRDRSGQPEDQPAQRRLHRRGAAEFLARCSRRASWTRFASSKKAGGHYTWWSQMSDCRARNIGWRVDYFVAAERLRPALQARLDPRRR